MNRTCKNFYVIILSCVLLISGCRDDWSEVEINESCFSEFETTGFIDKQKATVYADNSEPIYLKTEDGIIWPCNLPDMYQKEGLEVTFSAAIKALPTSEPVDTLEDGNVQYITWDYVGLPVTLTSLSIKD